jgi:hypothetical protein
MIYLYAITDPLERPSHMVGLQETPLESLQVDSVCGVYTTHERLECGPDPALLWRHDQVVEGLMELAGVLPLRFGTTLRDSDELRAILARDRPRFERLLARVRGCVELAVRVGVPPAPEPSSATGTAYLQAKLTAEREREGAANRVLAPLRGLAKATSRRTSRTGDTTVSESYLVSRNALEPFVAQVKLLQSHNSELSLTCTGPWGPYSFVDEVAA